MWSRRDRTTVSCIACGESVPRDDAREYDKEGDRWDREGKSFEYLCKPCFADLSKAPREGLEDRLATLQTDRPGRAEFLARYLGATDGAEERESDRRRHD